MGQPVQGDDTIYWVAPPDVPGNWMQTSNWSAPNVTDFYEFQIDNGGTAILSGGTVLGAAGQIGKTTFGRLIQTGGRLELDPAEGRGLALGQSVGGDGTFDLAGGSALMHSLTLGSLGHGTVNISAGELTVTNYFGVLANSAVHHAGGVVRQLATSGAVHLTGGEYNLGGSGRMEVSQMSIEAGGTFTQSGGDFVGSVSMRGSHANPASFQITGGTVQSDTIDLRVNESGIGSRFVQDGGKIDSRNFFVFGAEYTQTAGTLATQTFVVSPSSDMYGSGPAIASISNALKVTDRIQVDGANDSVAFQVNEGAVSTRWIYSPGGLMSQVGGSVITDFLDIWSSVPQGGEATYRWDGGVLFAERGADFAGDVQNSSEKTAALDFTGSEGVFAVGRGAHVEFGVNAKIENAQNGTFRLAPDALLIAPESLAFDAIFGNFDHHDVVRYERGKVLHVGEGQSVQVGGLETREGFDVDGRMYRNPGFDRTMSIGQFRVGPHGDLDLGWDAFVQVQDRQDAGVFGGSARISRLYVGQNTHSGVRFTMDEGGSLHLMDTMYIGGSSQPTQFDMIDGTVNGNRIMTRSNTLFQQTGGVVDVGTFSVEPGQNNVVKLSGGELRAEYMGIHQNARFEQTGGVASTEYLLMGGSVLALGENAEFHIRRQFTTTTPPCTVDFQSAGGTLYLDGAFVDLQAGIPFVNGQQGNLVIDEHSLVVLPGGASLDPYIGNISNAGIIHVLGSTLTIPADREIHGSGEIRLRGHKLDVFGKVLVDPTGGALRIEHFELHPGAVVELGPKGEAVSGAQASSVNGGVLRSGVLRIAGGTGSEFSQTAGEVSVRTLILETGNRYKLSGGALAFASLNGMGVLDLADSASEVQLAPNGFVEIDKINFDKTAQSHFYAAPNSLVVMPPGFDTGRFASFESDGMVQIRGEDLTIPAGQTLGGMTNAIVGDVTNLGTISPGLPETIGKIAINGDVDFLDSGSFLVEINRAGVDQDLIADSLQIQGMADLGGRLEVRLLEGREPRLGQEFQLLATWGGISGSFSELVFPSIEGLDFHLDFRGSSLYLKVGAASTCLAGDTAPCDGLIDLNDLNSVRNAFGNGFLDGPRIPGDTYPFDGIVDLSDLNAVRNHFGNAAPGAVPEPGAVALALVGMALIAVAPIRRQR